MSEIKIKCPKCGKILRLMDKPNINNSAFACPVCKEKSKVGDCQRVVVVPKQSVTSEETQYNAKPRTNTNTEETQYAGNYSSSADKEETRIAGMSQNTDIPKIGCLLDNFGRSYALRIGVNSIGRKATTSPATVQIDTADKTMSRNHAIIEVRNTGGQVIHILRNGANKNPSYLNGILIQANDQLILNNGDRVKFGNTELVFKRPL